ncbi:hypothetical protein [uncultured Flavobacterium sp.]|uniref:hypothetical protein n=1 Tax=uncultured Flavobacterium sp. TaxID=165435 RepID=UPI0025D30B08|nr:hypothetical protein [uncultured Flavobacterium sp.]
MSITNKFSLLILAICLCIGCKDKEVVKIENKEEEIQNVVEEDSLVLLLEKEIKNEERSVKILMMPCSNGYEYALHNYNFDPIIEREFKKSTGFEVVEFPYKKLMNIAYQGVYDKKYAKPIIEKVNADIFIMTRFTGNAYGTIGNEEATYWGYETKILNTKTMKQKVSIGANNLLNYEEIEKDIVKNIDELAQDIRAIK